MKIWECKIGEADPSVLSPFADTPMRRAVEEAYQRLTGQEAKFIFSGWAAELTEGERAVVENREPRLDPRTGRPLGDHGTAVQAVAYALDVEQNTGDAVVFLEHWREGNLDEWPEFYDWLKREEQQA